MMMFLVFVRMLLYFLQFSTLSFLLPFFFFLLPLRDFLLSQFNLLMFLSLLVGWSWWLRFHFEISSIFLFFVLFLFDLLGSVLQVEPHWKLEVQLAGSALMLSSEDVEQLHVDFRAIECTISLVQLVWHSELFKGWSELLLSNVPILDVSEVLLRSCGEFQHVLETKDRVNVIQEI